MTPPISARAPLPVTKHAGHVVKLQHGACRERDAYKQHRGVWTRPTGWTTGGRGGPGCPSSAPTSPGPGTHAAACGVPAHLPSLTDLRLNCSQTRQGRAAGGQGAGPRRHLTPTTEDGALERGRQRREEEGPLFPEHGPASTFPRKEQRPHVPSASITTFLWPQSGVMT